MDEGQTEGGQPFELPLLDSDHPLVGKLAAAAQEIYELARAVNRDLNLAEDPGNGFEFDPINSLTHHGPIADAAMRDVLGMLDAAYAEVLDDPKDSAASGSADDPR